VRNVVSLLGGQVTISGFCARTSLDLGALTVRRFLVGFTAR
jgi:hypothetical protein